MLKLKGKTISTILCSKMLQILTFAQTLLGGYLKIYKSYSFNSLSTDKFLYVFFFCRLLISFKINFFKKILSGIPSEFQTVWTQIRPYKKSDLIWIQTFCKVYQQTAVVGKELKEFPKMLQQLGPLLNPFHSDGFTLAC